MVEYYFLVMVLAVALSVFVVFCIDNSQSI